MTPTREAALKRQIEDLEFQIKDMKYGHVTAFLLGSLVGVVASFALILGF